MRKFILGAFAVAVAVPATVHAMPGQRPGAPDAKTSDAKTSDAKTSDPKTPHTEARPVDTALADQISKISGQLSNRPWRP